MNKKLIIILIFLIGIIYMPIVNAEELPREGVTYFITYPNGEETVTNNYDEAMSFKKEIEEKIPGITVRHVDPLSLSVSCHIGPGSLAIAVSIKKY
jgi:hypothetical protein